ncbi:hypothetical protein TNCT_650091, partial [Trichonephila clavata]
FLPNFGPSYVYLRDQKNPEDVHYNGRLLMAITTEIFEGNLYTKSDVKVDRTIPPSEGCFGFDAEFFLFACIQEVSLIDSKITEGKEIRFTLQIGTEGREQLEAVFEVDHTSPFIQPASINK